MRPGQAASASVTHRAALEERFRASHGRLIAALTRRFGVQRFETIENAVQDAYLRALERWAVDGVPDEPEGWLVRVAHNAVIDTLRAQPPTEILSAAHDAPAEPPPEFDVDDELRLIFLCCDPVLPRAAQIAVVLNVAFGLNARQIAGAFVSDERTIAQRIVRAKQRLREAGVDFNVPAGTALPPRLSAILDVLYLVYSEGHNPTDDAAPLDAGLCNEALHFARLLTQRRATATPAAFALRALLC